MIHYKEKIKIELIGLIYYTNQPSYEEWRDFKTNITNISISENCIILNEINKFFECYFAIACFISLSNNFHNFLLS